MTRSTAFGAVPFGSRLAAVGVARVAAIAARAFLFIALGLVLDSATYGAVAIVLTLGAAGSVLLDGGMGLLVQQRAGEAATRLVEALPGLLMSRVLMLPLVLGLHFAAAYCLLGRSFEWRLVLLWGAYAIIYPLLQAFMYCLRGVFRAHHESVFSFGLHGSELLWTLLWAVSRRPELWVLAGGLCLARAVAIIGAMAWMKLRTNSSFSPKWTLLMLTIDIRERRELVGISVFQYLNNQASVLFLALFCGAAETGRYWACFKVGAILLMPVDLVIQAALPQLASAATSEEKIPIFHSMHVLGLAWLVPVATTIFLRPAEVASLLLNASFGGISGLLSFVSIVAVVASMPPYGLGLAMSRRRRFLLRAFGVAAGAQIVLGVLLVPWFGVVGAGLASILSYLLLKAVFWWGFRAENLQPMPWRALPSLVLVVVLWVVVVQVLSVGVVLTFVLGVLATGIWITRGATGSAFPWRVAREMGREK